MLITGIYYPYKRLESTTSFRFMVFLYERWGRPRLEDYLQTIVTRGVSSAQVSFKAGRLSPTFFARPPRPVQAWWRVSFPEPIGKIRCAGRSAAAHDTVSSSAAHLDNPSEQSENLHLSRSPANQNIPIKQLSPNTLGQINNGKNRTRERALRLLQRLNLAGIGVATIRAFSAQATIALRWQQDRCPMGKECLDRDPCSEMAD